MPIIEEHDALKRQPDPLIYGRLIDSLSTNRRSRQYSIPRGRRFPPVKAASAASHIGPGHYRLDSDFPDEGMEQIRGGRLTRSARTLSYGFLEEDRVAEDGALKGNSAYRGNRVPIDVSPGSYSIPLTDVWRHENPRFTVPRAKTRGKSVGKL
mmetsp:Transcript_106276/g.188969  ORF Transcript_106276/g.188969 Transcript_106276/m.188969 type:complete len:153 (-) Transcript_106276:130-588(-)